MLRHKFIFLIMLILGFGCANLPTGNETCVYVSPEGDNRNEGLSPSQPLKNIQAAIDKIPELKKKQEVEFMSVCFRGLII